MLLALDVGNLTISVGLFDLKGELKFLATLDTDKSKTADQIAVDLMNLFQLYQFLHGLIQFLGFKYHIQKVPELGWFDLQFFDFMVMSK